MKNISQVILLSTSCLIWYGADNVCASVNVFSGIPKSGTHNTLHTTPYLAYPHLPSAHPRGVAESSPRFVPSAESAMLTSCLPQTLSNSLPEVGRAGGRKNFRWKFFSTPGESLLTGELVETTQSQCYKPRDRSGVSEGRAYEARREGMSSEASIPFSSNIEKMSLTGLIPPRELLTRLKSGEFLLPLPQGDAVHLRSFCRRCLPERPVELGIRLRPIRCGRQKSPAGKGSGGCLRPITLPVFAAAAHPPLAAAALFCQNIRYLPPARRNFLLRYSQIVVAIFVQIV